MTKEILVPYNGRNVSISRASALSGVNRKRIKKNRDNQVESYGKVIDEKAIYESPGIQCRYKLFCDGEWRPLLDVSEIMGINIKTLRDRVTLFIRKGHIITEESSYELTYRPGNKPQGAKTESHCKACGKLKPLPFKKIHRIAICNECYREAEAYTWLTDIFNKLCGKMRKKRL